MTGSLTPRPAVTDLGRMPFRDAYDQMLALATSVRSGEVGGKILLVEHEPVYTAGRATTPLDLSADLGTEVVPIERGGRITFHGPGQLVIYPVLRLPRRDARWWLRRVEAFGIGICASFGLHAEASVDGTGVFIGSRKVGSIGVALRGWVNLHGLAINVDMDLEPFHRVRPCGLDPHVMSDLSRAAGRTITIDEAKDAATDAVSLLFDDTITGP